jgi:hypothetical protein
VCGQSPSVCSMLLLLLIHAFEWATWLLDCLCSSYLLACFQLLLCFGTVCRQAFGIAMVLHSHRNAWRSTERNEAGFSQESLQATLHSCSVSWPSAGQCAGYSAVPDTVCVQPHMSFTHVSLTSLCVVQAGYVSRRAAAGGSCVLCGNIS